MNDTGITQEVYLTAGWIPYRLEGFAGPKTFIMDLYWSGPGMSMERVDNIYVSPVVM